MPPNPATASLARFPLSALLRRLSVRQRTRRRIRAPSYCLYRFIYHLNMPFTCRTAAFRSTDRPSARPRDRTAPPLVWTTKADLRLRPASRSQRGTSPTPRILSSVHLVVSLVQTGPRTLIFNETSSFWRNLTAGLSYIFFFGSEQAMLAHLQKSFYVRDFLPLNASHMAPRLEINLLDVCGARTSVIHFTQGSTSQDMYKWQA